jgi:PAS domain S-box-containing protein
VFVAGVNPHRQLDEDFRGFFTLLANQIAGAIANAVAYEKERKRAEALAELDRAKMQFFSNVSHEFRTPLTLLLGPLEQLLTESGEPLPEDHRQQLVAAQRNALRLLKLVNTLLDFSRIEAGRIQAFYEPTELCKSTEELASAFESAMVNAGLHFTVQCQPLGQPIYVDREMWEKIVLNLLSNAFKFTFEGEISLRLHDAGDAVKLVVRDTGVGIPQEEQGRIFERFHRVESTRARTYEGTGIGLSLVYELTKLHGGSVGVESELGHGSTFTVSIPKGKGHLPAERIQPASSNGTGLMVDSYVREAESWLRHECGTSSDAAQMPRLPASATDATAATGHERDLIVLADDNADMRDYVRRLLGSTYRVHAVSDGLQGLEATRRLLPTLVLADVMMPRLDGFAMLHAIRSDPEIRDIPVILLSARAAEESQLEGLEAGADDYLVKPFTARELLARIATHVRMARMRREIGEREAQLRAEAELERNRLQLAQAAAQIGTWEWDVVRQTSSLSAELHRMFGTDPGDPDHVAQWAKRVHPDDREKVERMMAEAIATGTMEFEYRYQHPETGLRWLYCKGQRFADRSSMFGVVLDVTERKLAEEKLQENHEQLQVALVASQRLAAIVASSDDAIVSKDLNGIVTSWNAGAERMFGYTAEEIVGRPIATIIPPELQADEDLILATIGRGERIHHFETVRLAKSGKRIHVSLTISPVRDESGRVVGAAKIARDISERKQAEQILRTSEKLASVGRLAATVAHEINNPLEAVTNLVYLAKVTAGRDDVREYLGAAEEELARVSHLTKQTLGFYREAKGAEPVKLGTLVGSLLAVFASRVRNKKVTVFSEIRQHPEIFAVPGEMRQLLANLISNSIDAVPEGGRLRVRVSAATEPAGQRRSGVRVTVADSGPGIPAGNQARLFQPFFTTKKDVGTGLGLWVCKTIVEKHSGEIHLKSSVRPGRSWTAFSVFLPLAAQAVTADKALKEAV